MTNFSRPSLFDGNVKAKLKSTFGRFLIDYALLFLGIIIVFFTIRLWEYGYAMNHQNEPFTFDIFMTRSVKYDTLFILITGGLLFVPAFLIALLHFMTYKIVVRLILFFIVVMQLVFTQFFLTNNTILTAVLLEFSITELMQIASHEVSDNRLYFWLMNATTFLLALTLLFLRFKRLKNNHRLKLYIGYGTICLFIIGLFTYKSVSKQFQAFESQYLYLIGNSKPVFFVHSYLKSNSSKEDNEISQKIAVIDYKERFPERNYTAAAFPLIYDSNDPNVLGPFFKQDSIKPNIVLIISESLTGTYSGKTNSIKGSLTPFTDSLADKGLYWSHFLANADRSFGALPNILSSLPYGTQERGFMSSYYVNDFGSRYPNHTGLVQYLTEANYATKYYFGGWKHFDKIAEFMTHNGIQQLTADHNFDTTKYKMKPKGQGEDVWGYNDRALFSQSIDDLKASSTEQPFFNIYQTLTVHSPYNLAAPFYYNVDYLNSRLASRNKQVSDIPIAKPVISCIMAADDDLRYFMTEFKKDPRYDNTIFIIVGDHGVNLNLQQHALERFHVPLIIFSPLIKKPANFKGMCSHIDIAPSLLALLEQNFNLAVNSEKHFIGQGLDTATTFNANRFIPLTINRLDIPSFIVDDVMQYDDQYFKLDKNWHQTAVNPEDIGNTIDFIEAYHIINRMLCNGNKIWQSTSEIHHSRHTFE